MQQRVCLDFRVAALALAAAVLSGCGARANISRLPDNTPLQFISVAVKKQAGFEAQAFRKFGASHSVQTQYLADVGGTVNSRLDLYQQLFRDHSSKPDLLAIDVVWPAILADELVDLKPYLGTSMEAFSPELISTFTVAGRLVALPAFVDVGMLYYRPDLLARYGFARPPSTWAELEVMAVKIQRGERRRGNKDFWGYTWQGGAFEGLTCNALEWQASVNAGEILSAEHKPQVQSPAFLGFLGRVTRWIGTISPPGEAMYREDESENLWNAGNVAFLRTWASSFGELATLSRRNHIPLQIAPLPAGSGGHKGALGGMGLAVSKYSANRDLAVAALMDLTSGANDLARVLEADALPVRTVNQNRAEVKSKSLLHAASAELMRSIVNRPAVAAGAHYQEVSHAYYVAVNSVLRREQQPGPAMAQLAAQLSAIGAGNTRRVY